jgi:hypothetical protein
VHCGSGFWGGQRPSLAHYVTGMGPMDGATAAEVVRVAYPPSSASRGIPRDRTACPRRRARSTAGGGSVPAERLMGSKRLADALGGATAARTLDVTHATGRQGR